MEAINSWLGILLLFLGGVSIGTWLGTWRKSIVPRMNLFMGCAVALMGLILAFKFHPGVELGMALVVGALAIACVVVDHRYRQEQAGSRGAVFRKP